jgi:hypothetical protein
MVAYICNPTYLRARDQVDQDVRTALAKSYHDPISTPFQQTSQMVVHTVIPTIQEAKAGRVPA